MVFSINRIAVRQSPSHTLILDKRDKSLHSEVFALQEKVKRTSSFALQEKVKKHQPPCLTREGQETSISLPYK